MDKKSAPMAFPSFKETFEQSWDTFIKSLLDLFFINIIGIAAFAVVFILGGIVFFATGALTIFSGSVSSMALAGLLICIILAIIAAIIIGSVLNISSILILDSKGKLTIGNAINKSFKFIIPSIFVGIITAFLTMGGFFLFILPGILLSYLFSFALYEVVLGNKNPTKAVYSSVVIVSKNFGNVLIRLILLGIICIAIAIFIPRFATLKDPGLGVLAALMSILVNILFNWFAASYVLTLYKQAKSMVNDNAKIVILWVWLMSIIGWIFAIFLIFFVISIISKLSLNTMTNYFNNQSATSIMKTDANMVYPTVNASDSMMYYEK